MARGARATAFAAAAAAAALAGCGADAQLLRPRAPGVSVATMVVAAAAALLGGAGMAGADAGPQPPLYVHLIPHSHCDPGWLSSFEGYYTQEVARILGSVVEQLAEDPTRRFIWAEVSFFMRWLETQPDAVKARVHGMVRSGQLEFIGGGWVQHDEANPSYDAILAQETEGLEYLQSLYGVRPRIAYAIDPFGHSAASAAVAAAAGYDALVINRIDFGLKDALKARAAMEFVWQPYAPHPALRSGNHSSAAGAPPSYTNVSIFTHVLHTHYSAVKYFDFENGESMAITDSSLRGRAETFVGDFRRRSAAYRSSHLLVPHGDDFKFQAGGAAAQFSNLDKLIRYINAEGARVDAAGEHDSRFAGVRVRYSTLSEYFDAVFAEAAGAPAEAHASQFAAAPAAAVQEPPAPAADGAAEPPPPSPAPSQPPPPPRYSAPAPGRAGHIPFPVVAGADFFPYADNDNSWWTGYYTTRASLKQAIRRTMGVLRAADGLFALVRPWASAWQEAAAALAAEQDASARGRLGPAAATVASASVGGPNATSAAGALTDGQVHALSAAPYARYSWLSAFQRLEQARLDLALCLHHDAITGTSRDHVVDDYTRRMAEGASAAMEVLSDTASLLLGGFPRALAAAGLTGGAGAAPAAAAGAGGDKADWASALVEAGAATALEPASLTHIPHVLPVEEAVVVHLTASTAAGGTSLAVGGATVSQPVVLYNPTGWERTTVVTVMVDVANPAADAATGTGADDAATAACKLQQWPYALVTDAVGAPVPAQWLATVEAPDASAVAFNDLRRFAEAAGDERAAILAASRAQGGSAAAAFHVDGRLTVPLAPSSDAKVATAPPAWVTAHTRYELSFRVTLPAYGLGTYFVTAAWNVTAAVTAAAGVDDGSDDGVDHDGTAALGCSAANMHPFLRRHGAGAATTAVVVQGLAGLRAALSPTEPGAADGKPARLQLGATPASAGDVVLPRVGAIDAHRPESADEAAQAHAMPAAPPAAREAVTLENACLAVEVSAATGLLTAVTYKRGTAAAGAGLNRTSVPVRVAVRQSFGAYHTGNSGAYIFRPADAPRTWDGASGLKPDYTVTLTLAPRLVAHEGVAPAHATGARGSLLQQVRTVSSRFQQSIRLVDTLGFHGGEGGDGDFAGMTGEQLAAACADPLRPDGAVDLRPVLAAGGNEEVVMLLETDIDVTGGADAATVASRSPNLRDHIKGRWQPPSGGAGDGANSTACDAPPAGWWTSDGLALLPRRPAPLGLGDNDIQRHYYPLNTLTRVAGPLPPAAAPVPASTAASAWLSIYTTQPFGTSTRITDGGGSRVEVMMHRHLTRDDGRGLGTGVIDTTTLAARLLLTVHGVVTGSGAGAAACPTAAAAAAGGRALPPVQRLDDEWTWAWSTRAHSHHLPVALLHADLADLAVEEALAAVEAGRTGASLPAHRHAPAFRNSTGVLPPHDRATHLVQLPVMAAEAGVPRDAWTSRYGTSFAPLASAGGGSAWATADAAAATSEACVPPAARSGASSRVTCAHLHSAASSSSALPPWVHALSLQVRDAVTDDVIVRLHNVGGPSVAVDVRALLSSPAAASGAVTPVTAASLRPRTLTLNRHEGFVVLDSDDDGEEAIGGGDGRATAHHAHRVDVRSFVVAAERAAGPEALAAHPLAGADLFAQLRADPDAVRADVGAFMAAAGSHAAAARVGGAGALAAVARAPGDNQNTDEEGVFVSDAALEKLAKKAAADGVELGPAPPPAPAAAAQDQQLQQPPQAPLGRLLLQADVGRGAAAAAAPGGRKAALAADVAGPLLLPPATMRAMLMTLKAADKLVLQAATQVAAASAPQVAVPLAGGAAAADDAAAGAAPDLPEPPQPGSAFEPPRPVLTQPLAGGQPQDARQDGSGGGQPAAPPAAAVGGPAIPADPWQVSAPSARDVLRQQRLVEALQRRRLGAGGGKVRRPADVVLPPQEAEEEAQPPPQQGQQPRIHSEGEPAAPPPPPAAAAEDDGGDEGAAPPAPVYDPLLHPRQPRQAAPDGGVVGGGFGGGGGGGGGVMRDDFFETAVVEEDAGSGARLLVLLAVVGGFALCLRWLLASFFQVDPAGHHHGGVLPLHGSGSGGRHGASSDFSVARLLTTGNPRRALKSVMHSGKVV